MREAFAMWRHTQMVVLVALSAAIYAALLPSPFAVQDVGRILSKWGEHGAKRRLWQEVWRVCRSSLSGLSDRRRHNLLVHRPAGAHSVYGVLAPHHAEQRHNGHHSGTDP